MKINFFKVSATSALPFVLLAIVLIPANTFAAVDTCTWTGAANSNTNNVANWTGCDNGNLPEVGDSLIFPSTATNKTVSVNANIDVDTVTFNGAGAGNYSFTDNGSSFFIRNSFLLETSGNTIGSSINFSGAGSRSITSEAVGNSFTSNVLLSGGLGTMNINVASGATLVFTTGTISGFTSNLLVGNNATGIVEFNGANTFTVTNPIYINNVIVRCENTTCLGNVANVVEIADEAILRMVSAVTFANPISSASYVTGIPRIQLFAAATLSGILTLNHDTFISVDTGISATLSGNIVIASGKKLNFLGQGDPAFERIIQNGGIVSGDGGLTVKDVRLELHGANTYTGTVTVNAGGVIQNYNATGLGTTANATIIENGGAMFGLGNITIAENINIVGNGATGWRLGALGSDSLGQIYTGSIFLSGNTMFITPPGGSQIAIQGPISQTGDIEIRGIPGSGNYLFSGATSNTYIGTTTVRGVVLTLDKTGSAVAIPGNLNVIAVALSEARVNIISASTNNIADTSVVSLTNSGSNEAVLAISNFPEDVGMVTGNGRIESDGPGFSLGIGVTNASGIFSGIFDNEDGTIIKQGTGTWDLTGATFPGGPSNPFVIQINAGTVLWNSALTGMPASVLSGGTLKGTGIAGQVDVNSGGTINVGTSPGCMTVSLLNMLAGSIFAQEIAGATACTGYDQVTVTGAAVLNGTLTPVIITPTVTGNVLTIINAGSISGTFTGLAENATLVANGRTYRINYTATTVTLTDVTPAPVFSGGGGSYNLGGCRDALAINYERYATFQSGTCLYAAGVTPTATSTATTTSITVATTATSTPIITGGNGSSVIELFNTNLRLRSIGKDVKRLQQFLNSQGFTIAKTGVGSAGQESEYFGIGTRAALIKFQEKYTAEILTPNGLTKGSGLFFTSTRAQANKLLQNK